MSSPEIYPSAISNANDQDAPVPRSRYHDPDRYNEERERYGETWLRRLRQLPAPLFQQVIDRLVDGQSAKDVATWLFEQPDRGPLNAVGYFSLRKWMQVMKERVDDQQATLRRINLRKMAAEVRLERRQTETTQAITQRRQNDPKSELREIEQLITERAKRMDARMVLSYLLEVTHERMERARKLEEGMGMPLDVAVKLTDCMIKIADELRKTDMAEWYKRKAAGELGEGGELPYGLPPAVGGLVPKGMPSERTQQEADRFAALPPADRLLMRDAMSKMFRMVELNERQGPET